MPNIKKDFVDVGSEVFYLDPQGNPVKDTVIAIDFQRVIENKKPVEVTKYVLESDMNKHVTADDFYTSMEELKKKIDAKFK